MACLVPFMLWVAAFEGSCYAGKGHRLSFSSVFVPLAATCSGLMHGTAAPARRDSLLLMVGQA